MGNVLKVLVPAAKMYANWNLVEIHVHLIEYQLYEDFGDVFTSFRLWGKLNHSGSFFGKDEPERMKKEVENWNKDIESCLKTELDKIAPFKTGEEVMEYLKNNSSNLYNIRRAINAYDNYFQYGNNKIVYDKYECASIRIPEDLETDILEHPEDYAIIEVFYD